MTFTRLKERFWEACTSRTVSTVVLVVLTAMLVIGSLLPNPNYLSPDELAAMQANNPLLLAIGTKFNNQQLVTSFLFVILGVFVILSAAICSIERLAGRRNAAVATGCEAAEVGCETVCPPVAVVGVTAEQALVFVAGWLSRRLVGADIRSHRESGLILAKRGKFGFWGSILFHLVLITALAGIVVNLLGETRGRLTFTEGQSKRLERSSFRYISREPIWGFKLPAVGLELLTQKTEFAAADSQTAVEHLASFRVTDLTRGTSSVADVRINTPLRIEGLNLLLMNGGFSPRFVIRDGGGTVFDAFVALNKEQGRKDDFTVAGKQLQVEVAFFPDFVLESGRPSTKSLQMKNPAAGVIVTDNGKAVFSGVVPAGGLVSAGGYTLAMPEVRRWVELEMANEPGIGAFFFLSFFGVIGLILRLLDPDEELIVRFREDGDQVVGDFFGRSKHFQALQTAVAVDCGKALLAWSKTGGK